jgi:hypothetical protein
VPGGASGLLPSPALLAGGMCIVALLRPVAAYQPASRPAGQPASRPAGQRPQPPPLDLAAVCTPPGLPPPPPCRLLLQELDTARADKSAMSLELRTLQDQVRPPGRLAWPVPPAPQPKPRAPRSPQRPSSSLGRPEQWPGPRPAAGRVLGTAPVPRAQRRQAAGGVRRLPAEQPGRRAEAAGALGRQDAVGGAAATPRSELACARQEPPMQGTGGLALGAQLALSWPSPAAAGAATAMPTIAYHRAPPPRPPPPAAPNAGPWRWSWACPASPWRR